MGTSTETTLIASGTAASAARRIIDERAELGPFPDLRFAARLLVSELVSNAVRHAGLTPQDELALSVECTDESFWVEVRDSGPGFDPLVPIAEHERLRRRHRGLFLVNALADRWGFRRSTNECRVWFELDLVPGRRPWRGREPVPKP